MTLLVDIGNSRVKWAHIQGGALTDRGETAYLRGAVLEVFNNHWLKFEAPQRVFVSSVAGPAVSETLSLWAAQYWACPVVFITAEAHAFGVTSAYEAAEQLGADRWASLIAAYRNFKPPVCVVDCGTAITIDVLAARGKHLGGLIVPGLTLMRRSLSDHTGGIREVVSGNVSLLARNTRDGVTAGTLYAAVAVIDRVVSDVEAELQAHVSCVLSGGDARSLAPLLARHVVCEPDLVLQGLAVMAEASS